MPTIRTVQNGGHAIMAPVLGIALTMFASLAVLAPAHAQQRRPEGAIEGLWGKTPQDCQAGYDPFQAEGGWMYIGRGAIFYYQESCRIGTVATDQNRLDIKSRCLQGGAHNLSLTLVMPDTLQIAAGSSRSTMKLCGKKEPEWVADAKIP